MRSELIQNETITPFKKDLLPGNSSVFVFLPLDLTKPSYIDLYAPRRISTIIAASIINHSSRVEQGFNILSDLETPPCFPFEIHGQTFDYVFKPSILEWRCAQSCPDSTGNSIIVRIDILSGKSGTLLESLLIDRTMNCETEVFSNTCELLIDPLEKIVPVLFQDPGQQKLPGLSR